MSTQMFGAPIPRNVDPRLLRGEGAYVDDIPLTGALHAAFLRSPFARARIVSIDVSAALAYPGVAAVYTCDNIGALDMELPLLVPHPCLIGARTQRPLARDDVFYVGQTIAMVVAVDRYTAEDAAALIDIDYESLDVTVELKAAAADGAALVHPGVIGNIAADLTQTSGDPDAAFARAEHFTKVSVRIERSTAAPLECRAVAARYDSATGELTVWDSTQGPIPIRGGLAAIFNIDEDKVRVIAPDVGGGFGQKVMLFYPDEVLVPNAAMELGVPVKFIEDRSENFLGSNQERTQVHELELAANKDGEVLGVRDTFLHDTGAFIPYGIAVAQVASTSIAGPYRIPNIWIKFQAIYTPTVPVSPYRGCGRPQACFAIERAMDKLADELGMDRIALRRKNMIRKDEFPYLREGLLFADGLAVRHDSGDYQGAVDLLEAHMDIASFRTEQAQARKENRYLGFGFACYVEGTGLGPYEGAHIRIHPITGKVYVNTGLTTQGQGHETIFAQIVADQLGVAVTDVIVTEGDTKAYDWGAATYASRAAVVSGNAVYKTALLVREQVLDTASGMLEVAPIDLELADGEVRLKGFPERKVTLAEVATISNPLRYTFSESSKSAAQFASSAKHDRPPLDDGAHPGIEATDYYSPPCATWAYGGHAAIVEVDPELCTVKFLRYVCLHDCGRVINPMIVEGQIRGGLAQGIGGALYERIEYDEDGNPRNANFMDFLMPYATEVPEVEILHMETPSPLNPLGVKGVGEGGTIAVGACVASAIEDALQPFGIERLHEVPLTSNVIHATLERAKAGKS
jgi:carbon-monoxide dehydrogenase large subunit